MSKRGYARVAAGLCLLAGARGGAQELTLADVFGDHMVVQAEMPLRVWGTARPGAEVTVRFRDARGMAVADAEGHWMATLDPQPVSAQGAVLTARSGETTREIKDILTGEVWLASGQSNMRWILAVKMDAPEWKVAADTAEYPLLRLNGIFDETDRNMLPGWHPCTPPVAKRFSATAFFFGRNLQQALGVPVGLICRSVGGTPIELWMPESVTMATDHGKRMRAYMESDALKASMAAFKAEMDAYTARVKEILKAQREGKDPPPRLPDPKANGDVRAHRIYAEARLGSLYDSYIKPLMPLSLRGIIWHQGESNSFATDGARGYQELLPALIQNWRAGFRNENMAFLFVQLQAYDEASLPEMRESMRIVAESVPNVGMATAIDGIGLHPLNKPQIGDRLSRLARGMVYGEKDILFRSPYPARADLSGSEVVVTFRDAGDGLKAASGKRLDFELAGSDGVFRKAQAQISAPDKVRLSAPDVPKPLIVRYAWMPIPRFPIVNSAGIPALPFRIAVAKDKAPVE